MIVNNMRNGFTTGSCAAAASYAATIMLLTGEKIKYVTIMTPAGIEYNTAVCDAMINNEVVAMASDCRETNCDNKADFTKKKNSSDSDINDAKNAGRILAASCAVIKDSGDDPDSTNGIKIYARAEFSNNAGININGGVGIGRVTRPGLENRPGEYAINKVPRQMIRDEVLRAMDEIGYEGGINIIIYAPDGEEIAKKTFNPHMGIEGGISILGTSGIVKPMSTEAILATIELDIKMKRAEGEEVCILVPGNYGETFLNTEYGLNPQRVVHFSNYIGKAIDMAIAAGFEKILVVGHTGKMAKVSGGVMNTHSQEADCRMPLMLAAYIKGAGQKGVNVKPEICSEILDQISTTAALSILERENVLIESCEEMLKDIIYYLKKRAGQDIQLECILYENCFGKLAQTEGVDDLWSIL